MESFELASFKVVLGRCVKNAFNMIIHNFKMLRFSVLTCFFNSLISFHKKEKVLIVLFHLMKVHMGTGVMKLQKYKKTHHKS